jgi:hypothetical protein
VRTSHSNPHLDNPGACCYNVITVLYSTASCSGGTNTIAVIVDSVGKVLARQDGPGTNGWLVGPAGVADILIGMFHKAKDEAGLARDVPLHSIVSPSRL